MELNEPFKFNPIAFCASLISLFFFNILIEELKSNEHVKLLIDYIFGLCVIYFFVGELKKMLSGPTGLHHQDQKLLYKDKERDSNAFLDMAGVKDRSKIVVMEDPISQEKRYLEMRRNAKMEKASKSISEISLEVDRLAGQVLYDRRVSFLTVLYMNLKMELWKCVVL